MVAAAGTSVSQAGNNTLVLGTGVSMNEYVFSGNVTVTSLVTTLSSERYNVSVLGSLNVTGTGGTTFNNRGALRIGVSSADIHQLNGSLTVASNTSMTLSGQLTANGNVAITPRVTVQSAGPALLAANGGTLTVGEVFVSNGVNLTLGSATTSSISTSWICGTGHATAGTVSLQSAGSITIADVISSLTDLTLVNSTGTDCRGAVTVSGNLQLQNTTGTVMFRGNAAAGAITAAAGTYDLQLLSGASSTGATSLDTTGTVTLGDGPNMFGNPDTFVFGTGFTRSGGPTQAFANIRTTNSALSVAGTLTAIGNSVLRSGNGLLTLADVVLSSGVTTTGSAMVLSAAGGMIGTAANPLEYSSGTLTTPNNASTTVFIRDASPNAGTVIGRYDFGRTTVVQDWFLGVSSATIFSSTAAYSKSGSYGFVTRPTDVLRSTTGLGKTSINLYADSVLGTSAVTYRVRLPSNSAGPYEVRAYFGDRDLATNTVITGVSGTTITAGALVSNPASPLAFPMATATVSDTDADGILTFQFARPTGYTGYWSVIGMDIATGTLPSAAPQVLAGLDFVPGGALTEASQAQLASVERRGAVLSEELILEVREQVLAAWATTGLSAEAMALLQSTTVEIRDMNDRGMLGASGATGTTEIWL
ncbi:MAG: hypothetical protein ACKOEO_03735, partial [Planctomycetaceae bacterium]